MTQKNKVSASFIVWMLFLTEIGTLMALVQDKLPSTPLFAVRHAVSCELSDQDFSKIVKIKKGQNFA